MKAEAIILFLSTVVSGDALGFRDLVEQVTHRKSESDAGSPNDESAAVAAAVFKGGVDQNNLQLSNCWSDTTPAAAWHPVYSAGWTNGYCQLTVDCNSPSFSSEAACCKGAYAGQISGYCLQQLPSPPTTSPTEAGGLDVYYPDYDTAWSEAGCINTRPMPSGRPTYSSMVACCKGAYGGQVSGKCLGMLPSPPTSSPTTSDHEAAFWYPDYDTSWAEAGCSNALPLPFKNKADRPNYSSLIACCKGAYGGQTSGKCLSQLDSPPTTSPTGVGGLDVWYPDYDTAWTEAGCINEAPLPSGRPTYDSRLACCKGAYGGQVSGKCLSELEAPPTTSPTGVGGLDIYYPDYDTAWSEARCINDSPLPSGRPTYSSMIACCKGAYAGQVSGKCLASLPSPPTASPTGAGGLGVFYPNYDSAWPSGTCINDNPLPSGRPTYSSKEACCSGAYGGQTGDACMCDAVGVCFSCSCGSQAERDAANCSITCS